jgi:hypothetical protein
MGVASADASTVATFSAEPLPASPVIGTVTSHTDQDDVYSVELQKGEAFTARIKPPSSAVMALLLYLPGAESLDQNEFVVAGWETDRYPSYLVSENGATFVAPETGNYYLRIIELGGLGDYTVDWAKGAVPHMTTWASASAVSYGRAVRFSGALSGSNAQSIVGERMELWSAPYPSRYATKFVASTITTTGGLYSFSVVPRYRTSYKVVSAGTVDGYAMARSASKAVAPRVYLGTPRVSTSTKYRNRVFYTWGTLKPRHAVGSRAIKIRCYLRRSDGKYVLRKTVSAVNANYGDYTRYRAKITLPYRGRWKLYAYTSADALHAATLSYPRSITVR